MHNYVRNYFIYYFMSTLMPMNGYIFKSNFELQSEIYFPRKTGFNN